MADKRPCGGCERGAPYGTSYDAATQCLFCHHFHTRPEFFGRWGGKADRDETVGCPHRGGEVGRELCPSCRGHVEVKLFKCEAHGKCTTHKKLPGHACCQGCQRGPVVVHANANGIGDALLGLCAVAGLKGHDPKREVVYQVSQPWQEEWCKLFLGYDRLTLRAPQTVTGVVKRLHDSPGERDDPRFVTPRWEHYAKAIGAPCAMVPPMRPLPREALDWAERFKGAVALAPFSVWMDRAWDDDYWHRLEDMLYGAGHRTVILDGLADGPGRASKFRGEPVYGEPAVRAAALLKSVRLLVANDSGCAHMGGMLKVPTLIMSWFHSGHRIHGLYGTVKCIHADHVRRGGWKRDVTPEMVFAKAREMLGEGPAGPAPPPPPADDVLSLSLLTPDRLDALARAVRETEGVPGDMAELGVYLGGAALHMARSDAAGRAIRLFDTFAGLPADDAPGGHHKAGEFAAAEGSARRTMAGTRAEFHVGVFPATAPDKAAYSCVHVDGDLYQTTKDALAYFWPRLSPGGVMVLDDWKWPACPGVVRAVEEAGLARLVEETVPLQALIRKPRPK